MEIFLAEKRGFCQGVERAIGITEQVLADDDTPPIVLKEIVHNQVVVERLKDKGVKFVNDLAEIETNSPNSRLIFSAHGVSPKVRTDAQNRGLKIVDATCPLVEFVHKNVQKYLEAGYTILYIGHRGHDEVVGVLGEAESEGSILLVQNLAEVDALRKKDITTPLVWLSQTTLSVSDTAEIIERLHQVFPNLEDPKRECICLATSERQESAKELANKVGKDGLIIVVGSANSSNTRRLADLTMSMEVKTIQVDTATQIDADEIVNDYKRIGITSGASVPEDIVKDIVQKLERSRKAY